MAKTAQIPHKILKAMSDWIVELEEVTVIPL